MKKNSTEDILKAAELVYLSPEICTFTKRGDFLSMEMKGKSSYNRVELHRLFPFGDGDKFISVMDSDSVEIGIIKNLDDFPEDMRALISAELERKYYVCKLSRIINIKDRFGFTYWDAVGENGNVSFTLTGASSNVIKNKDGKIFILDIDGNRYELPPADQLDRATLKKLDVYL